MKNIVKKLSLLMIVLLCATVFGSIACAAEAATEAPSYAQTEAPSEATPEDEQVNDDEKKGIFSNLDPMNSENITKSLEILAKGMVAIFAVIIIIIIVVKIIQKVIAVLTAPPKNED